MESIRGYDKWLTTPPDDDPICEGEHGCGEVLIRTPFSDGWFCNNEFCPEKFQSTEQRMAEALVDALEEVRTLKAKVVRMKRDLEGDVCSCTHDAYESIINRGHCDRCGKPFRRVKGE